MSFEHKPPKFENDNPESNHQLANDANWQHDFEEESKRLANNGKLIEDPDTSDFADDANSELSLGLGDKGIICEDSDFEVSQFASDSFKPENSFDARVQNEFPDLNNLKSKCVYEVQPMGTPDEQIDRSPIGVYSDEERKYIKDVRESIDAPTENTIMQKVIAVDTGDIQKDLSSYLNPKTLDGEPTDAQVYGFVSKAEDAAPFSKTPQECYDNLRLDYKPSNGKVNPYQDPNQPMYAIRFTDGTNYEIPYSEEFGGVRSGLSPFTGNGFLSARDVTIPEYTVQLDSNAKGAVVTDGEIYRINPDGMEEVVATFNKRDRCFELVKEEG